MSTERLHPDALASASKRDRLLHLTREMLRIRVIEQRIADRYGEKEMRCPVHLSIGQEAVAVGVCAHLRAQDKAMSAHRSHGHYLGRGGDLQAMLGEIYGRTIGCCGGRGGSMHLIDQANGFWGAVPIVGSTLPIALGLAVADHRLGRDALTVAFLGEGATEEGVFAETLNLACVLRIPMLFVCEDNGFSVYTPIGARRAPEWDFEAFVRSHGALFFSGHGNDVDEVFRVTGQALSAMRADPGRPCVVGFDTWRYYEHCGPAQDDHLGYRDDDDIKHWAERCPVAMARRRLSELDPATSQILDQDESRVKAEVDAVIETVRKSPRPQPETLLRGVFAP